MLTNRRRYVAEQKKLNADLIEKHGKIPENYLKATELRLNFFKKFVLNAKGYETSTEKDWSYVAAREYYWDVNLRSFGDAIMVGWAACLVRTFMLKKFNFVLFAPVAFVTFLIRYNDLSNLHAKKYFDMCNLGDQYFIGRERNKVLKKCNELLDTEDF